MRNLNQIRSINKYYFMDRAREEIKMFEKCLEEYEKYEGVEICLYQSLEHFTNAIGSLLQFRTSVREGKCRKTLGFRQAVNLYRYTSNDLPEWVTNDLEDVELWKDDVHAGLVSIDTLYQILSALTCKLKIYLHECEEIEGIYKDADNRQGLELCKAAIF